MAESPKRPREDDAEAIKALLSDLEEPGSPLMKKGAHGSHVLLIICAIYPGTIHDPDYWRFEIDREHLSSMSDLFLEFDYLGPLCPLSKRGYKHPSDHPFAMFVWPRLQKTIATHEYTQGHLEELNDDDADDDDDADAKHVNASKLIFDGLPAAPTSWVTRLVSHRGPVELVNRCTHSVLVQLTRVPDA